MKITTEQFNSLLTKDDLKNLGNSLISKDEFNNKCNQIIDKINGLDKEVRDFHAEMASNQVEIMDF